MPTTSEWRLKELNDTILLLKNMILVVDDLEIIQVTRLVVKMLLTTRQQLTTI